MKQARVLGSLFLATTIHVMPAIAASNVEVVLHNQMQTTQMNQGARQGQPLQSSPIVRPSIRERDAISEVLMTKPRPKTLTDADIKYLKELRDKPAWFGFEQRIVHEIWTEVMGKEWRNTEGEESPRNKTSP